jgi:hypothetical protein
MRAELIKGNAVPKGQKRNLNDWRQRKAAELQSFVKATGRRKRGNGQDPNDRRVDRKTTIAIRHMPPVNLDTLLRDGEDAD